MRRALVKAALAGMLALLFAVAPARCDSVNLVSSTDGAYTYTLVAAGPFANISAGDTLTLTGLAGVTGASTNQLFSASSTPTTASAEDTHLTVIQGGGGGTLTIGNILTVDSTSLTIGTIDWELSGPDFSTPLRVPRKARYLLLLRRLSLAVLGLH